MQAVVIKATITDRDALPTALDELVPEVSGAPGFVAGYWIVWDKTKASRSSCSIPTPQRRSRPLLPKSPAATPRRSTASKSAKSPRMHRTAIARPSRFAVSTSGA